MTAASSAGSAAREELGRGKESPDPEIGKGKGVREQVRSSGGLLIPRGGTAACGDSGVGRQGGMGAGPVATVEEEDDAFAKTSPGTIFLFTKGSISSLVNLVEALNHFYKFNKNL